VSRPTVGITAGIEPMTSGAWTELTAGVPFAYARAVQAADARAELLVPDEEDARAPDDLLGRVDAVIVSGGAGDVDPAHYGAARHPRTVPVEPLRDRFELALVRTALNAGLPVLGICRGMQVLNVACGGTLEQHLPDVLGHDRHATTPGSFADHEVRLEEGSLAARAVGEERAVVKSYHHQGVRTLGDGLRASGFSLLDDGIVEAIELPGRPFALGVLWHPEEDERSRVVAALVAAARERAPVEAT
jgi:putative glutamine amidotransferase